jgi:hypothetical protein
VPKLNNILSQLFMDMIKEEASIHEASSPMSTLNDHETVAPTGDEVGIFWGLTYPI